MKKTKKKPQAGSFIFILWCEQFFGEIGKNPMCAVQKKNIIRAHLKQRKNILTLCSVLLLGTCWPYNDLFRCRLWHIGHLFISYNIVYY